MDKNFFCDTFGYSTRLKILCLLLEGRELDYGIGDVAHALKINRQSAYNNIGLLLKDKFIIKTRKLAGAQLYKLNKKNKKVAVLIKCFDLVLNEMSKQYDQKKGE